MAEPQNPESKESTNTFFGIPYKDSRTGEPSADQPGTFKQLLTTVFGSGLGTGNVPIAQGTLGSALFVLLWILFVPPKIFVEILVSILVHAASVPLSGWGEKMWGHDPGRITIDEFAGQSVALIGVKRKFFPILLAFLFFRLYDSIKLPVIKKRVETLPGGWGVTLDDTAAGLMARFSLGAISTLRRNRK